jgi:hypothetical protein
MKQLLSLFLFLLPCLAWAQYPSNGNQKITLGEQTTADGLIWRGVLADTGIITPSRDTSAFIILDTVNHRFYNYNRATNVWSVAGGGTAVTTFSGGTTGLTPNTATSGAVTLGGTLAVANGGTGATTLTANKVMVGNGTSGVLTPTNLHWDNTNSQLGIGETANTGYKLTVKGDFPILFNTTSNANSLTYGGTTFFRNTNAINNGNGFQYAFNQANGVNAEYAYFGAYIIDNTTGSPDGGFIFSPTSNNVRTEAMRILNNGNVGIETASPTQKLHVVGNARITAMNGIGDIGADANGVLQAATSDINLKNTIENSPFGLNEILLLNPVTFLYNDTNRKLDSNVKEVGFIAQDVFDIIPNAVSSTGMGDLQLDYRAITATLTKAIQEQQALIKALEQRIINLENK